MLSAAPAPAPLRLHALASGLNPPAQVQDATDAVSRALDAAGVAHTFDAASAAAPDALVILTGGTEHLALDLLERLPGPALLIAHPEQNSLPAALEILGRARQLGRAGRIYQVGGTSSGAEELARIALHAGVRRRLWSARLGRIGAPSDWLVASSPDAAAVTRVWGPAVVDVPINELLDECARADPRETAEVAHDYVAGALAVSEAGPDDVDRAARVVVALRTITARHRLDACAVRCFDLVTSSATTGCLALSWLLDAGIVAGCEGDVPATITMMWMQAMSGGPSFLANPQHLDPRAQVLDLAHCTIARALVSSYTLRSHFESSLGVAIEGTLDPGDATVARVGAEDLRALFVSDAEIVGGASNPRRCRTQVRVRLAGGAQELLHRPIGNHLVLARGHWSSVLKEYHDLFVAR